MTSDGKIYIIVTDKAPEGSRIGSEGGQTSSKDDADGLFEHWARNKLINTTESIIKRTAMYQISNIGNFTGDYMTQTHINDALSNLRSAASIGTGALSGFVATGGNPIGALIGASLSLINTGLSSVLNIHSMRVQNNKTNYEIAQLRDRAGLNSLKDNSRGTEN